jgi:predicted acetyltransferase
VDGWVVVDRAGDGPVRGYAAFHNAHKDGRDIVNVGEIGYDDIDALRRLLHFLASLRDQYSLASLTLPVDLPLNRLLRETQLPHRLVNHPHAEARPCTRMQLRVLDHKRLIEAMKYPADVAGKVVVAVKECEGNESRFAIEIADGRASVTGSEAAAEFECSDRIWAGIVTGDIAASDAVRLGLASAASSRAEKILAIYSRGPIPFSQEYF